MIETSKLSPLAASLLMADSTALTTMLIMSLMCASCLYLSSSTPYATGEPEPVAVHFSSVMLPNGSTANTCGPVLSMPPMSTCAISGAYLDENSRFATSRAAELIGIGLFVLSRYSWAFALRMSTAFCASATPPDIVMAMWSSIL